MSDFAAGAGAADESPWSTSTCPPRGCRQSAVHGWGTGWRTSPPRGGDFCLALGSVCGIAHHPTNNSDDTSPRLCRRPPVSTSLGFRRPGFARLEARPERAWVSYADLPFVLGLVRSTVHRHVTLAEARHLSLDLWHSTIAGPRHPFAGSGPRSWAPQVGLRKSRQPASVSATHARSTQ